MKNYLYLPDHGAFDRDDVSVSNCPEMAIGGISVAYDITDRLCLSTDERPFHIGQGYEDTPARMIACGVCHGTAFEVGRGDFYTAIRCVACRWECVIHEG